MWKAVRQEHSGCALAFLLLASMLVNHCGAVGAARGGWRSEVEVTVTWRVLGSLPGLCVPGLGPLKHVEVLMRDVCL